MLTLTENAVDAVQGFLAAEPQQLAGKVLRVYVEGGGCSGFQYGFAFSDKKGDDQAQTCEGFEVVVDPTSLPYLDGAVVDFVDGLQGKGFTVENPNANGNCGCGKSFSV